MYAFTLRPLGFLVTTAVVGALFSWLFGERIKRAALFAVIMSVVSYFLLTTVLQLNVPAGLILGG